MKTSFIIPTFNEQKNIHRCLNSIGKQTYPHKNIDIIIADGHSTDSTLALIDDWNDNNDIPVRIVHNDKVIAEFGKAAALRVAEGDLLCLLDCDEELVQEDALSSYVRAFDVFPDITGVEPHFLKIPGGPILNNYLAVTHYTDPLGESLAIKPHVVDTKTVDGKVFRKLEFGTAYGCMLFLKRDAVAPFLDRDQFHEGTIMPELSLSGANKMCMIDGYGVWHHHVESLADFMRKRSKIATKFMTRSKEGKTWVNYARRSMCFAAVLNLTLLYQIVYSCTKAAKHREPLWLLHPPMCFLTTLSYTINWLRIKATGRKAW